MRVFPVILLPAMMLAACGTPLQVCVTKATQDLTVVDGLIAETMENLGRGYALEKRPAVHTGLELCVSPDDPFLFCTSRDLTVEEKAVAIDATAEEAKLRSLRAKRAELAARSEQGVAACQVQFPPK